MPIENVVAAATSQIVRQQRRIEMRVKRCPRRVHIAGGVRLVDAAALGRIGNPRGWCGHILTLIGREADARRIVGWIDNPQSIVLVQKRLLISHSGLDVMNALHIRNIGPDPRIGQSSVLPHRLPLQTRWPQIREGIVTGIVVIAIPAHEGSQRKDRIRIQYVRPCRGDVKRSDLRPLVCRSHDHTIRRNSAVIIHVLRIHPIQSIPGCRIFSVVGVWCLEPASAVTKINVNRVRTIELIVHPVEEVFFISLVVHNGEFRRIQESPCIHAVHGNKISPALPAVRQVRRNVRRAERSIRSRDTARGRSHALPGASGNVNHNAGLISKLRRRRSRNHLHALNRIHRNLVGENFACLVAHRLPVNRK